MDTYKIVIVGSGPAGLSAAARCAVQGIPHVLLEKTDHCADTLFKFQKGKFVMSTPDVLPLRAELPFGAGQREDILQSWNDKQAELKVNIRYQSEVTALEGEQGRFEITLADGEKLIAENVVLAIGLQGNLNKLRVPGADQPFVQYQLDDPDEYEHERIIIIGNGDAGIENALALTKQNTVYMVNREDEFPRAKKANEAAIVSAIDRGDINHLTFCDTREIGDRCIIFDTPDGELKVDCDRIIARIGAAPPRRLVESFGVEFPSDSPFALPEVDGQYQSNVKGLYIVGALGGFPLIKQALNQGYEVVEFILGNAVERADDPVLRETFAPLGEVDIDEELARIRREIPMFAPLNPMMLREMMLESTVHAMNAGDLIFERNDYTNSFFSILDGSVAVEIDPDDTSRIVNFGKGEFFGEMGLISGRRRTATVRAAERCILIETPRRTMLKIRGLAAEVRDVMDREAMVRQVQANILPGADRESLRPLLENAEIRSFARDQLLFSEGDPGDNVYLIRKGSVVVSQQLGGRELVLSYVAAGNYVGEMALLSDQPRMATVKAAVACETICIDGQRFKDMVAGNDQLRSLVDARQRELVMSTQRMRSRKESGNIIQFLMEQGIGEATDVLLIDESLCVGCDNCEVACAETHEGISRLDREAGPTYANVHVPTSCRHCEHPHCMTDCPPDAIRRSTNGEVFINDSCIGCGNCVRNCPYGVIQLAATPPPKPGLFSWMLFGAGPGPGESPDARSSKDPNQRKTAVKCDMCKDLKGGPACVRACPTGAALRVNPQEFVKIVEARR